MSDVCSLYIVLASSASPSVNFLSTRGFHHYHSDEHIRKNVQEALVTICKRKASSHYLGRSSVTRSRQPMSSTMKYSQVSIATSSEREKQREQIASTATTTRWSERRCAWTSSQEVRGFEDVPEKYHGRQSWRSIGTMLSYKPMQTL